MVSSCCVLMLVFFVVAVWVSLVGRLSPLHDEQLLQGVCCFFWMLNHFSNWRGMQLRVVLMRTTSWSLSSSCMSWFWWYWKSSDVRVFICWLLSCLFIL